MERSNMTGITANMTGITSYSSLLLPAGNSTGPPLTAHSPKATNALLYIVIVLMFYAFSIVVLMIKYVRREKEEAEQRNFFNEFVKRDKFSTPQFQNRLLMQKLLNVTPVKHEWEFKGRKNLADRDLTSETLCSAVESV